MRSKKIEEIDGNFTVTTNGNERFTYFNIVEAIMKEKETFYDDSPEVIRKDKIIDIFHISGFPWLNSNVPVLNTIFSENSDENSKNPDVQNKSNDIMKLKESNVTLYNTPFCRLDILSLEKFNSGLQYLAWLTSGGVIRFASDTDSIALKVKLISKYHGPYAPNRKRRF